MAEVSGRQLTEMLQMAAGWNETKQEFVTLTVRRALVG